MNRFILLIAGFIGLSGFAVDLPIYLGEVKGVVLTTLTGRETFEFNPGQAGPCTKTTSLDMILYKCEVKNATAKVTPTSGEPIFVVLDELSVFYISGENGQIRRRYILNGKWTSVSAQAPLASHVHLELWNYKSSPQDIKGTFTLSDYGMGGAVQATQQP